MIFQYTNGTYAPTKSIISDRSYLKSPRSYLKSPRSLELFIACSLFMHSDAVGGRSIALESCRFRTLHVHRNAPLSLPRGTSRMAF